MGATFAASKYPLTSLLALTWSVAGQEVARPASKMVEHFSEENRNTLTTFQALAAQTHTVMGVSGTWIGSDHQMITVNEQNAPLSKVLNDICHADPRYSWAEASDGSIQIRLGRAHLDLLDVVADSFDREPTLPEEIASAVLTMPEFRSWPARNKCSVGMVIVIVGSVNKPSESPISTSGNS